MLASEVFLQQFRPLDIVIRRGVYLPNWELTKPGYNDGGIGQRFYFHGPAPSIGQGVDTIRSFLNALSFASTADQTNAVAAAITVVMRNHFLGTKPFFPITANKSHAGKGTVASFIAGCNKQVNVSYETTDWAFQKSIVALFNAEPNIDVLNIDNVRLDKDGEVIRSAFLERLIHEQEPVLYSSGTGKPRRFPAHFVVVATSNKGLFSDDLMNRGVLIRLEARGNIHARVSPIGDPKNEFLPKNRERIEAELHGMIRRWIDAGSPRDPSAKHAFTEWASIVGGILKVNGFADFLRNRLEQHTEVSPIRRALGSIAADCCGEWKPARYWASVIVKAGVTKELIGPSDARTPEGLTRGTGIVLSAHIGEHLVVTTEDERITFVLRKERLRFEEGKPEIRYCFEVIDRVALSDEKCD